MPDESPKPDCVLVTLPIDTTITGKGTYFQVPIFPHWLPYIGQIAFLSGALEGKWNVLLESMFLATETKPENNWKLRKGKNDTNYSETR